MEVLEDSRMPRNVSEGLGYTTPPPLFPKDCLASWFRGSDSRKGLLGVTERC